MDPNELGERFLEASARGLLPEALVPLFDRTFVRSSILYEEYTYRLALSVFRGAGLERATLEGGSADEIASRAGLDPERVRVPLLWILRQLAARGALETSSLAGRGTESFRARSPLPELAPAELVEEQRVLDPSWLPSYTVAETAAKDYPAFLRGEIAGEEILFSPTRLGLWFDYFSNDNGLYTVNNRVMAAAARIWLPAGKLRILELGGGLGSAATAFLEGLQTNGRLRDLESYRFTEIAPAFLRRGQRALVSRFGQAPLSFGRLDMNARFEPQGVAQGSTNVVLAVNTLHVARDLGFTLGEIRESLAPGGVLLLGECIRPFPGQTVYAEFVFNLIESFRSPVLDPVWRPNGGFLTPEQWTGALEAGGLAEARLFPDIARLRSVYPGFYVAAIGATRPA